MFTREKEKDKIIFSNVECVGCGIKTATTIVEIEEDNMPKKSGDISQ